MTVVDSKTSSWARGHRSGAEWQRELAELVASLSASTGVDFRPTSWHVEDDRAGVACACNCVHVRGVVDASLDLEACGMICVTVSFGEAAWASSDVLLFAAGERVRGPEGADFIFFSYGDDGWTDRGWVADGDGEWESHTTDEGWGP